MIINSKLKIQNSKFVMIVIIIIAAILRLYQLGNSPPSLDWDEASLGYNAYSILKTGKDEFGRSWPVSIRSFEDYKPVAYTYLTIPSVAIFGLNEFAVRLPSAMIGITSVILTFYLIRELYGEKIAYITSFLLAISPWHLQFSRIAFEANVALGFVLAGLLCFLLGFKRGSLLLLSAVFLSLSFYSYHSPRLVIPLLLIGWSIYYHKQLMLQKKYVVVGILIGGLLLIPFAKEFISEGRARFNSVTVLTSDKLNHSISQMEYDQKNNQPTEALLHNRRVVYMLTVIKGYLDHFNFDFLFLTGDAPARHHAQDMGMLYMWEAPFILVGMVYLLRKKENFPIFWWFLVAPAASALTSGTPHAVRALLYLPTYQVFTAFGLLYFYNKLQKFSHPLVISAAVLMIILTNIYYYFEMYYIHSPIEASREWQYGYKQAVAEISHYESQVDQIVMTYDYDQPHVYILFYEKIDPVWYQNQVAKGPVERARRSFGKYTFRMINWDEDKKLQNSLIIGSEREIPSDAEGLIKEIKFLDGTIAFRIVKR